MISYLITIWKNQYTKFLGRVKKICTRKKLKSIFKKIYKKTYKNIYKKLTCKNSEISPASQKKNMFLVPQPKFSTYEDLKNSSANSMNISGYWGEHIIKKELKSQKFRINNSCTVENRYGDLDIIAYKQRKDGRINRIEFHEIKTLTKGCTKENINLSIDSQMRHLLSAQQRKGGAVYTKEILQEQVSLGNFSAQKLLRDMKTAKVEYILHKIVIDKKGQEVVSRRQNIFWKPVHKQSIIWNYIKTFFK